MTLHPRARLILWGVLGAIVVSQVVLSLALSARIPRSSKILRDRIVAALADRLDSDVEIGDLTLRLAPALHAEGTRLTIRKRGRPSSEPPLISVESFTVDGHLMGLARRRVSNVTLKGLVIQVPPDDRPDLDPDSPDEVKGTSGTTESLEDTVVIDTLESTDARLVIIPHKAGKKPKEWAIHKLRMENVGRREAMPFKATVTNAVPPGAIETNGSFGPWRRDDPGRTPLNGAFTFERADLSVFHGILGTLSAAGGFRGTLDRIAVDGVTDTPDFTVKVSGHPFALHAKYRSIVDGTNGDTILERIDATFGQTSLVAKGKVADLPDGLDGRAVQLDITMDKARLEDVLRMAIKQPTPPMVGALKMTTKFLLPPGHTDVVDRLQLDGSFTMARVQFTSLDVQSKINDLSRRSRGRAADDHPSERVASDFQGRFTLGNGRLALPTLTFAVPGSRVEVAGAYLLRPETLDFGGTVYMDAKISQTMSGFKSVLLKVVDPFFRRKGGGSAIPIKVEGNWENPAFGLDMHRVFHRNSSERLPQ